MKEVMIRKVQPTEIQVLRTISIKTFVDTFADQNTPENMEIYLNHSLSIEKIYEELHNPLSEFYFALTEDEIIGYLKLNFGEAQSEPLADAIEIERIYIQKSYHGKQIAPLFLNKTLTRAHEINASFIWLGVWEHNARAIAFYTKHGFISFGTHPFMLGDDMQTDVLMKRALH